MNTIGYQLLYLSSCLSLAMWSYFVLDFKWKKPAVLLIPVWGMSAYMIAEVVMYRFGLLYAGIIECSMIVLVALLFASGSLWRNYFILSFGFVIQNFMIVATTLVSKTFQESYLRAVKADASMELWKYGLDFFVQLLYAVILTAIFSRVFRKKYKGNDFVYKILVAGYLICYTLMALAKEKSFDLFRDPDWKAQAGLVMINIIGVALFILISGNLYNWFEAYRISREKKKIDETVRSNYNRLKQEMVNPALPQSLSGDLVMDSMLMGYGQLMQKEQIVFESMVQPFSDLLSEKMDMVTILDSLLGIALSFCKTTEKLPFVWLSIRKVQGHVLLRIDFKKAENLYISKRGLGMLGKEQSVMKKKLLMVEKLVEGHNGIFQLQEEELEVSIRLVLMD